MGEQTSEFVACFSSYSSPLGNGNRLSRQMSLREKEARIAKLIDDMGLQGKEDQRVGGMLSGGLVINGLSGGEKRRLSLCCGIITRPKLLLVDEPTSGLDGFAALMMVQLLKQLCSRGTIIILTIHQVSSSSSSSSSSSCSSKNNNIDPLPPPPPSFLWYI